VTYKLAKSGKTQSNDDQAGTSDMLWACVCVCVGECNYSFKVMYTVHR